MVLGLSEAEILIKARNIERKGCFFGKRSENLPIQAVQLESLLLFGVLDGKV